LLTYRRGAANRRFGPICDIAPTKIPQEKGAADLVIT
jgi:hypothetical protein